MNQLFPIRNNGLHLGTGFFRVAFRSRAAFAAALALAAGATPAAAAAEGPALFAERCADCHGAAAEGVPGIAPALVRPDFWRALGPRAPEYLAQVMIAGLSGRISAGGLDFIGLVMPSQADAPDDELARIGAHVLGALNGLAEADVTPADIAAARAAPASAASLRKMRPAG